MDAVKLEFVHPPPWYVTTTRYGLYGFTGLSLLIGAWIVGLEWPKIPMRPLPDSVQGPVMIYAEEDGQQVPCESSKTRPTWNCAACLTFSPYLPKALIASEDTPLPLAPGS